MRTPSERASFRRQSAQGERPDLLDMRAGGLEGSQRQRVSLWCPVCLPMHPISRLSRSTAMYGHRHVGPGAGHGVSSVDDPTIPCASWSGRPWEYWSSPRCPASTRSSGSRWSETPTPAGVGRRRPVPVPLDAAVRAGGSPAVAARKGLRRPERWESGDVPQHRRAIRPLEIAYGWR